MQCSNQLSSQNPLLLLPFGVEATTKANQVEREG
jgi:hypothetical protein